MNRSFKIVGRYSSSSDGRGKRKPGLQAKKSVYTSEEDFMCYAPTTAMRWRRFSGYDVSAFELINGEWVQFEADFAGDSLRE